MQVKFNRYSLAGRYLIKHSTKGKTRMQVCYKTSKEPRVTANFLLLNFMNINWSFDPRPQI